MDNNNPYTYTSTGSVRRFGARYGACPAECRNSDISIWLSVDPLSDKYPSLSPYMYCAGNPVILVDPDGRDIVPTNEAGEIAINFYLNKFNTKTLQKVFGVDVKFGNDRRSGRYPIYTSSHKGTPMSYNKFCKAMKTERLTESELQEAYAFYQGLTSEKQYKVEAWTPEESFTTGENIEGSVNVEYVTGYAPREVNNNKTLESDLNQTNFDLIFNPERKNNDSKNKYTGDFNFYYNYGKNIENPNDRNTVGVIVIDARKESWQNVLGKAFKVIFE